MNPTLSKLLDFVPQNDAEIAVYNANTSVLHTYLDNTKSSWSGGKYYLGGQIKLGLDDEITPELIAQVWNKFDDSYACNSAELASIWDAKDKLSSIETIIKKYNEIQKMRILHELNKTKLISDINKEIVSFM
jgi:hypothetical protein